MSWLHEIYVCERTTGNTVEMSGPTIREHPIPFEPFQYEGDLVIKLPEVAKEKHRAEFLEVFSGRRSIKQLGACPLDCLSQVLYYAVKPYGIGRDDYGEIVYRSAAPSAGGRHPIDILVGMMDGGVRRLFLYQTINHSLKRLGVKEELQAAFFDDIETTLPMGESVILWFSVQYMRTASKYTDYMTLIWRDVGAQLCCLQQMAKYVGMDSCPIGYLAEEAFYEMFQTDLLKSGGGLIIGNTVKHLTHGSNI